MNTQTTAQEPPEKANAALFLPTLQPTGVQRGPTAAQAHSAPGTPPYEPSQSPLPSAHVTHSKRGERESS